MAIPTKNRETRLKDMQIGEEGWVVPWAVWFDQDETPFINEAYRLSNRGGTVQLRVKKTPDGYIAWVNDTDYGWSPQSSHGFSNEDSDCFGKVVGFSTEDYEQKNQKSLQEQLQNAIEDEDYETASRLRDEIAASDG